MPYPAGKVLPQARCPLGRYMNKMVEETQKGPDSLRTFDLWVFLSLTKKRRGICGILPARELQAPCRPLSFISRLISPKRETRGRPRRDSSFYVNQLRAIKQAISHLDSSQGNCTFEFAQKPRPGRIHEGELRLC